ncbi:hypothetical protein CBOM_08031 [Ceraceosorus bombacis]|uniref:Uncharacterized protein n=1 Tax=Ceraceosorus bombacis TaxID=401625 RepID=A0A0P1BJ91_9BASI|nr:hypothetical protein CBOM_08031 [Ceraceosorus bombacis]
MRQNALSRWPTETSQRCELVPSSLACACALDLRQRLAQYGHSRLASSANRWSLENRTGRWILIWLVASQILTLQNR